MSMEGESVQNDVSELKADSEMDDTCNSKEDDFVITHEQLDLISETPRSQFAAVIFNDTPETYTADTDIECHYSLTSDLSPSSRDWVGLYRVGWMSCHDYIYYEWAPVPEDANSPVTIIFPKKHLPPDNGEFYQYCYVTRTGQIRGASTPFQFRKPRAEDFVEIEDEDDDLLVIRPSKIVLEEKLRDAEYGHKKLQQLYSAVEQERDGMQATITQLNKDMQSEKKAKKLTKQKLFKTEEAYRELSAEIVNMKSENDELRDQLSSALLVSEERDGKLKQLLSEVVTMNTNVKALQNERDELAGKTQSLVEEKELYKNMLTSLETTSAGHIQTIESLKKHLSAGESDRIEKSKTIEELMMSLSHETEKVQQQQTTSNESHMKLADVMEQLSQAENKLAVCEERKVMLTEEIEAYTETQQKMSRDLENSEMEVFNLREQIRQLHEEMDMTNGMIMATKAHNKDLANQVDSLKAEVAMIPRLNEEIVQLNGFLIEQQEASQELDVARETIAELQASVESGTGSLFALQKAHDSLKTRLSKYKTAYDDARKQRDQLLAVQKLHVERENELKKEVEDMRVRTTMCNEEYKALYIKCVKQDKKLAKMRRPSSRSGAETSQFYDEMAMSDSETSSQLNGDAVAVGQLRCDGKEPERDELELLRDGIKEQKGDEVKQLRGDEVNQLKQQQFDMQADFDYKSRFMENVLTQKDAEIAELRRLLAISKTEYPQPSPSVSTVYPVMINSPYMASQMPPYPYPVPTLPQESVVSVSASMPQHDAFVTTNLPEDQSLSRVGDSDCAGSEVEGQSQLVSTSMYYPIESDVSLDPPLQPQVTTSAKMAAIKSVYNADRKDVCGDVREMTALIADSDVCDDGAAATFTATLPATLTATPSDTQCGNSVYNGDNEEERYQDAAGESMKICPTCAESFPFDVSEIEFETHMVSHFGHICPVCQCQLEPSISLHEFEMHVQKHFTHENVADACVWEDDELI